MEHPLASSASLHEANMEKYELELLVEERPVEESVGYAVFEELGEAYLIYKVHVQPKDKEWKRFAALQPIYIADHTDFATQLFPWYMMVFSVGSKIYFVGGQCIDPNDNRLYLTGAYMFDTGSRNQHITPIQSMSYPKPQPDSHIIGPLHDDKVYLFGTYKGESSHYFSFEMLDTRLNKWNLIPLQKPFSDSISDRSLPNLTTSAVCGSNIVIFNPRLNALHIYSTTTKTWREVNFDPNSNHLGFFHTGRYLFETKRCYFVLARRSNRPPSVYSCPKAEGVFNRDGIFKCLGEIESMVPKMYPRFDMMDSMSTLNPPDPTKENNMSNRTCIITHGGSYDYPDESDCFAIKVCNLSLQVEEEWSLVKFEAKCIMQCKIRTQQLLKAHHFFVV